MVLTQFVGVGYGIARAVECLEAVATNPADVYMYWLAILGDMEKALSTSYLPEDVLADIRGIMNSRFQEFFVEGPTNVHLAAFYLNPSKFLTLYI